MKISDSGVLESSYMDFLIPSEFSRDALFYSPQVGHFRCDEKYSVNRDYLDYFLLIYLCEGSLEIETRGHKAVLQPNQIALIDCHYPHRYACHRYADFLWVHFNGNSSKKYADYLYTRFDYVFMGKHILLIKDYFDNILAYARHVPPAEHIISLNIHNILGSLAVAKKQGVDNPLNAALDFIYDHFSEEINLKQLAAVCNLSTSHFIRMFKKYMNCTPHEYLVSYRLRQAKQMLLVSGDSLDIIAEKCGFNSASHFARAFRKSSGMAPCEFRNMQF